jgi:hypothetical protein
VILREELHRCKDTSPYEGFRSTLYLGQTRTGIGNLPAIQVSSQGYPAMCFQSDPITMFSRTRCRPMMGAFQASRPKTLHGVPIMAWGKCMVAGQWASILPPVKAPESSA